MAAMEILRHSIEQLSAPVCPDCHLEMSWSRSMLRATEKVIEHVFICDRCSRVGEIRTPMKSSSSD
jgi:C4-type Zn-finger protein